MGKIFKQLARHWAACLVVVALLIVQACATFPCPDYTSKIVDIRPSMQGGIESPRPQTLRSATLDALSLLMREEDAAAFENAYEYYVQDDGVLKLRSDLTADERAALEEAVTMPDIVLYMTASQTANGTGMPAQSLTPLSEYPPASSGEEAASSAASPTARAPTKRRPSPPLLTTSTPCAPSLPPCPDAGLLPRDDPAAVGRCTGADGRDHPFQHGQSGHPPRQLGVRSTGRRP